MAASITVRKTKTGRRFVVRYRLGGRAYPVEHGGSFMTLKEARSRRDMIAGELAAGRNPGILLAQMRDPAPARLFRDWAEAYRNSRVDTADATRDKMGSHLAAILPTFADRRPDQVTPADVQAWVVGLELKPSSIRRYLATLRLIFDFIGIEPNPARDHRVRLPRENQAPMPTPPTAAEVAAIIKHVPARYQLLLRVLAETGMRVGEACALEWRDVDLAGMRFRVREGKTHSARRWVAVPDVLMLDVGASTSPDDRAPERNVFPGMTVKAIGSMMRRACQRAGTAHYHPHDLRHRWASVQVKRGVPITEIAAHLGHSKTSMTWDVYSHVLLDEDGAG
jgi:integrase